MTEKNKIPEIRFEGFGGAWGRCNINDTALFIDGNYGEKYPKENEFIENGVPFFTSAVIGTSGLFNKKHVKYISEEKNLILVKAQSLGGDLILTNRGASMGVVAQIPFEYGLVNIGPQLTRIRGTEKAENLFLLSMFKNPLYNQKLLSMNAGSAMNFFGLEALGRFEFKKPKLEEQTKIGNYFQQLDSLITLHQDKHDKLLNVKKAMLEKMFPKKGADVPEIRFKGFSEKWEEREFSTVVTRLSSTSEKAGLPRVEYEDIVSSRGELNKNIYQKESSKIGIEFDNGDVLFGKLRPYLKNWLLPNFNGIAVGDFWVLRGNETSSKFIYYLIQTLAYETAANQSSGTKMPRSDWNLVSKTLFSIPVNITEQTKIGNFFKNLDTLLSLHQTELEKLKNIKKACLEKMFV